MAHGLKDIQIRIAGPGSVAILRRELQAVGLEVT
jgi:ribosomal protein S11